MSNANTRRGDPIWVRSRVVNQPERKRKRGQVGTSGPNRPKGKKGGKVSKKARFIQPKSTRKAVKLRMLCNDPVGYSITKKKERVGGRVSDERKKTEDSEGGNKD